MRQINLEARDSDIFKSFKLEGDEVVRLTYSKAIDDIMLVIDGGDVFVSWDLNEWDDEKCIVVREKDNLKEIGKISVTHLLFKSKDGAKVKVYSVAQLN